MMTDGDNSSEGFLGRWSRKKAEAEREAPDSPAEPRATKASLPGQLGLPERHAGEDAKAPAQAAPKPEFDLASLPSLDSITAATDIRTFLVPGVPQSLARAALRRAWVADPAIRDFVGLAENAWDFTDPTAMAGFGELPPDYDVKKLLAQIFSEGEKETPPDLATHEPADPQTSHIAEQIEAPVPPAEVAQSAEREPESSSPNVSAEGQQVAQTDFMHRNNNIAVHNSIPDDESEKRKRRRQHGGALPQ